MKHSYGKSVMPFPEESLNVLREYLDATKLVIISERDFERIMAGELTTNDTVKHIVLGGYKK